ncbi:uncharacterized protein LOC106732567 [Pelodiscus sinensis]|uniref:uncharacterized protein LOC106732567 n=1 Tax=Pelodiscus sinensis TaxID=13735 RepID=UPI003F6D16B4
MTLSLQPSLRRPTGRPRPVAAGPRLSHALLASLKLPWGAPGSVSCLLHTAPPLQGSRPVAAALGPAPCPGLCNSLQLWLRHWPHRSYQKSHADNGKSTSTLFLAKLSVPLRLHLPWPELHEDNPDDQQLQDEEDDDPGLGVTLTLEPVPQTQDASQASSDPEEGTSAGPSVPDGQATSVPPPSWVHGSHRHWCMYQDLTRQHIRVLQRLQETIAERMRAKAVWQDHLLDELVQQRTTICSTMREIMAFPGPVPLAAAPAPLASSPPPQSLPCSLIPCYPRSSCSTAPLTLPSTVPGPTQLLFHQGPWTRESRSLWSMQHPQP